MDGIPQLHHPRQGIAGLVFRAEQQIPVAGVVRFRRYQPAIPYVWSLGRFVEQHRQRPGQVPVQRTVRAARLVDAHDLARRRHGGKTSLTRGDPTANQYLQVRGQGRNRRGFVHHR